jgi:quinol monooxygenase YgiN
LVELAVKPGQLANFEKLTGQMVASTLNEAGVLGYQRFVSDDRQMVHAYERYQNSATAIAHLHKFVAKFGERYESMVDRKRFYGVREAEPRFTDSAGPIRGHIPRAVWPVRVLGMILPLPCRPHGGGALRRTSMIDLI